MSKQTKPLNTSLLSLIQLIGAILVIALHCRRLFDDEQLHFIQKSIFSRMVVPFFMVSASFFIHRNYPTISKHYLIHYSKQYLIWSAVYLPFFIGYLYLEQIPFLYYPLAALVGLIYTGMSYQLWYMPAFLTGLLLVHFSLKKWGWRITTCLASTLYLLGTIETYSSYLSETPLLYAYNHYKTIFFTSRNGLFYAPIFVLTGFFLSHKLNQPIFQHQLKPKLLFFLVCFGIEGHFIFLNQGYDKNFFFSLVPFIAYFVAWVLTTDIFYSQKFHYLKSYASYYYFIHVIPLELSFFLLKSSHLTISQQGWIVFFITVASSHTFAYLFIKYSKKPCKS